MVNSPLVYYSFVGKTLRGTIRISNLIHFNPCIKLTIEHSIEVFLFCYLQNLNPEQHIGMFSRFEVIVCMKLSISSMIFKYVEYEDKYLNTNDDKS